MTKDTQQQQQQAIERIRAAINFGIECAHIEADDALIEYLKATGSADVAEEFVALRDKLGFWYA